MKKSKLSIYNILLIDLQNYGDLPPIEGIMRKYHTTKPQVKRAFSMLQHFRYLPNNYQIYSTYEECLKNGNY